MRAPVVMIVALVGLAGCGSPELPESGVGFTDYNAYLRENADRPAAAPLATPGFSTTGAAAAIDAADGVVAPPDPMATATVDPIAPHATGARPRGDAPAGIKSESGEVQNATGGVSDEQDFAAVAARETIESDKARIEANRAQYVVIQPGSLPQRPGDTGPNIVEFALATNNAPGTQLYDRASMSFTKPEVACAKYASSDLAQQAFLAAGGPDRDRKNLDPDGDGFACSWDPRPFRTALQ